MTTYILVEDSFNLDLLQSVLLKQAPFEQISLNDVTVVRGGRLSAVKSLARSIVVRRQAPVLVVADADSTVPEIIRERQQNIEEIIKMVAGRTPVKVVLAVPELEAIWFQDIPLLAHLIGYQPPQDVLILAEFRPCKALEQLLAQSDKVNNQEQLLAQLDAEAFETLFQTPVIQEIVAFLESVRETADIS